MRDKLKKREYFNDFIDGIYANQEKRFEKLKNNQIKVDRIYSVKFDMVRNYLKIIFAKYSRGDDMFSESVNKDLHMTLTLFTECWRKNHSSLVSSQKNKGEFLNQYSLKLFSVIIDLLSISVLLDAKREYFNLISNFIDKDKVLDFLFNFFIMYKDPNRGTIKSESYEEFYGINEKFKELKEVIFLNDKKEIESKIDLFLKRNWFDIISKESIYGLNTSKNNVYCGYWCFPAAAIVKIKGLDDSSFRDNPYYPKDLIQ